MNFRIAIPSCGRSDTLLNKTIKYLSTTNIDFKNVDVFLSRGDELEEYTDKLKNYQCSKKFYGRLLPSRSICYGY